MISPDAVVVRSSDLVSAPIGSDLAMMDLDSGSYFVLDAIGAAIWEQLGEPVRVRDLCERLRAQYDVSEQRCEEDVLQYLEKLDARRLLRHVDEP
jgi:hypothetical protein